LIGFLANRRHSRLQQMLSSYIDGEVEPAELREVEEHLAACDSCRRELDTLRFTVSLLRELPEVPVRRSFSLSEAPGPVRTAPSLGWAASLATSMAALLLVSLLVGDITGVLVQTPGPEMDELAVTEQAAAAFSVAPAEVREVERVIVASEALEAVAAAAPESALPEAEAAPGIEVTVQTESETQVVEPETLAAAAPAADVQPTPAPPEPVQPSPPADAAAQQVAGAPAAAPESITVPAAPDAEQREGAQPPSGAAGEAPDEEGLSLPLWQLEAVFGGMAIALALVALWAILRRRAAPRI
jgi:anti-sigma factor RsiW